MCHIALLTGHQDTQQWRPQEGQAQEAGQVSQVGRAKPTRGDESDLTDQILPRQGGHWDRQEAIAQLGTGLEVQARLQVSVACRNRCFALLDCHSG